MLPIDLAVNLLLVLVHVSLYDHEATPGRPQQYWPLGPDAVMQWVSLGKLWVPSVLLHSILSTNSPITKDALTSYCSPADSWLSACNTNKQLVLFGGTKALPFLRDKRLWSKSSLFWKDKILTFIVFVTYRNTMHHLVLLFTMYQFYHGSIFVFLS